MKTHIDERKSRTGDRRAKLRARGLYDAYSPQQLLTSAFRRVERRVHCRVKKRYRSSSCLILAYDVINRGLDQRDDIMKMRIFCTSHSTCIDAAASDMVLSDKDSREDMYQKEGGLNDAITVLHGEQVLI